MSCRSVVNLDQFAFTIDDLTQITPSSRSQIFADIAAGRLKARKSGRKTWILREDLLDFLARLPPREIKASVAEVAPPPSTQETRPAAAKTPAPTLRRDADNPLLQTPTKGRNR